MRLRWDLWKVYRLSSWAPRGFHFRPLPHHHQQPNNHPPILQPNMDRIGDEVEAREDVEEARAIEAGEVIILMVDGRLHIPRPRATITLSRITLDIRPNLLLQRHIYPRRRMRMDNRKDIRTLKVHLRFQTPNSRSRLLRRATNTYPITRPPITLLILQPRHTCKDYQLRPIATNRTTRQ